MGESAAHADRRPEPVDRGALVPAPSAVAVAVPADHVQVAPPGRPPWAVPQRRPAVEETKEAVVNVTIGRIEVRAVPGNERRREPAAAGPKPLGLDEYLHRRGAGR